MDKPKDKGVMELAKEKASEVKRVKGVETLLARKFGLDFLMDVHIIGVDFGLDVTSFHQIAERVGKFLKEITQVKPVLVHIELYQ